MAFINIPGQETWLEPVSTTLDLPIGTDPDGSVRVVLNPSVGIYYYTESTRTWTAFSSGGGGGGGVTIGIAPFVVSGASGSITQATSSQNGYLSSTDFNTFNNKVSVSSSIITALIFG